MGRYVLIGGEMSSMCLHSVRPQALVSRQRGLAAAFLSSYNGGKEMAPTIIIKESNRMKTEVK